MAWLSRLCSSSTPLRSRAWSAVDPEGPLHLPPMEGVPGIIVLDARTMEIVSARAGYSPDVKQVLEAAAAQVKGRAPSY